MRCKLSAGFRDREKAFPLRLSAPCSKALSNSGRHVKEFQWDRVAGFGNGPRWFFVTATRVCPVRARMGTHVSFLSSYVFRLLEETFHTLDP